MRHPHLLTTVITLLMAFLIGLGSASATIATPDGTTGATPGATPAGTPSAGTARVLRDAGLPDGSAFGAGWQATSATATETEDPVAHTRYQVMYAASDDNQITIEVRHFAGPRTDGFALAATVNDQIGNLNASLDDANDQPDLHALDGRIPPDACASLAAVEGSDKATGQPVGGISCLDEPGHRTILVVVTGPVATGGKAASGFPAAALVFSIVVGNNANGRTG